MVRVLEVISIFLGVLLVRIGVTPYPGEYERLQERISRGWYWMGAAEDRVLKPHVQVTRGASRTLLEAFRWVVGDKHFGVRVFWVSVMWSMAAFLIGILSFFLALLFFVWISGRGEELAKVSAQHPGAGTKVTIMMVMWGWSFFMAGLVPGAIMHAQRKKDLRRWMLALAIAINGAVGLQMPYEAAKDTVIAVRGGAGKVIMALYAALFIGVAFDVLFFAVYRWALRKSAEETKWGWGFASLIALIGVAIVLTVLPAEALLMAQGHTFSSAMALFVLFGNTLDVLLSVALIGVVAAVLTHRLLWAPWQWLLYFCQQHLPNKKVVGGLAGFLILWPFAAWTGLLEKVIALIG